MKRKMELSAPAAAIIGICLSVLLSIILGMIVSILIEKDIVEASSRWVYWLIWGISVFCGAMLGSTISNAPWIIMGAVTSIGYLFIMCGVGLLFFNDGFHNLGGGFLSVLTGFGIHVSLHFWNRKGNSGTKRYRYRP